LERLLAFLCDSKNNQYDNERDEIYKKQRNVVPQRPHNSLSLCEITCSQVFLQNRQHEPVENENSPVVDTPNRLDYRVFIAGKFYLKM